MPADYVAHDQMKYETMIWTYLLRVSQPFQRVQRFQITKHETTWMTRSDHFSGSDAFLLEVDRSGGCRLMTCPQGPQLQAFRIMIHEPWNNHTWQASEARGASQPSRNHIGRQTPSHLLEPRWPSMPKRASTRTIVCVRQEKCRSCLVRDEQLGINVMPGSPP